VVSTDEALFPAGRLAADSVSGSTIRKAVPRRPSPWELRKTNWPRCLAMIRFDRQRPRPVPCRLLDPGHLLFTHTIQDQRARHVVTQLTGDGLFSGWGIRTLSEEERTYNPMSYHRGSVWPHDNSLIAFGIARYGYKQEASAIFSALFETSLHFREYRLPELFCGNQRHHRDEPVQYPVSCRKPGLLAPPS
jgi:glycogen debranching enzyme